MSLSCHLQKATDLRLASLQPSWKRGQRLATALICGCRLFRLHVAGNASFFLISITNVYKYFDRDLFRRGGGGGGGEKAFR